MTCISLTSQSCFLFLFFIFPRAGGGEEVVWILLHEEREKGERGEGEGVGKKKKELG